ncbi:MAG: class I SAM-dependent methyltransferase [Deltaproteobacteria bacterium]|nr:class I SAM-dependent methyltransferase [Deltaproteobacteria bacterium]
MDKRDLGIRCTACRDSQSIVVLLKESLSLRKCLKCGTVFLGGYSDEFVQELYDYYDKYANLGKEDVFDPITTTRCQELLSWFSRFGTGREVLDVGCGLGQFVDVANRSGWIAEGLELSREAVNFARRQGLAVRNMDFLSGEIRPKSYDLVTLFEVIEHVPNPAEFLQRAGEVVRPGGLVYLTTPNFASLDRFVAGKDWKIIHPEHLTYFTPRTLKALVKNTTHFEILHLETRNVSIAALRKLSCGLFSHLTPAVDSHVDLEVDCDLERQTHDFRRRMSSSTPLGLAKRFVNGLLNLTGLGVTMVMFCCAAHPSVMISQTEVRGLEGIEIGSRGTDKRSRAKSPRRREARDRSLRSDVGVA